MEYIVTGALAVVLLTYAVMRRNADRKSICEDCKHNKIFDDCDKCKDGVKK